MTPVHFCVVACVLILVCLLTVIGHLLQSRHYQSRTLFDPGTFLDGNPVVCTVDLRGHQELQRQIVECYGLDLAPAALIVSGIPDEALVRFVNEIQRIGQSDIRQDDRNIILQFAVRRQVAWLEQLLLDSFDVTMPFVRPGVP